MKYSLKSVQWKSSFSMRSDRRTERHDELDVFLNAHHELTIY